MFAAPSATDVEAQRVAQMQGGAYGDYSKQTTTTTTTTMNPAQGQPVQSGGEGTGVDGGKPSTISRLAHKFQWGTYILLISYFSMILMIAAAQVCDATNTNCLATRGYQVALGTISMVVAFIFGVVDLIGKFDHAAGRKVISAFLFLWWLAGVIVLTFIADFTTTVHAAGYFSTWAAFIISSLTLVNISNGLDNGIDNTLSSVRKPLFYIILASLVVMGAAIAPCSPSDACNGYSAYALVIGIISAFFAIILFLMPGRLERRAMRWFAALFVIWWVFGLAVTTLGGPFQVAGNGFFATYAALFSSVYFFVELDEQV